MENKFKKGDVVEDGGGNISVVIEQYDNGTFKCLNPDTQEINTWANACHNLILEKVRTTEMDDFVSKKLDNWDKDLKKKEQELEALTKNINNILRWKKIPEEMPTIEKHYLVRVKYSFPKNYKAVIAELKGGVFYSEDDEQITDAIAYTYLPNDDNFDWE